MGKKAREKRKKSSQGDSEKLTKKPTTYPVQSTLKDEGEKDTTQSVSQTLNETNIVLYGDCVSSKELIDFENLESTVFETPLKKSAIELSSDNPSTNMDSSNPRVVSLDNTQVEKSGSTVDIMKCLSRIELRITGIEQKLSTLDKVEKKVSNLESDVKKLWLHLEDINKNIMEKVVSAEERLDNIDFSVGHAQDAISQLEKENNRLKENLVYLQSQSMRNNLIFCNKPES